MFFFLCRFTEMNISITARREKERGVIIFSILAQIQRSFVSVRESIQNIGRLKYAFILLFVFLTHFVELQNFTDINMVWCMLNYLGYRKMVNLSLL